MPAKAASNLLAAHSEVPTGLPPVFTQVKRTPLTAVQTLCESNAHNLSDSQLCNCLAYTLAVERTALVSFFREDFDLLPSESQQRNMLLSNTHSWASSLA